MFTGLVENIGSVVSLRTNRDILELKIAVHELADDLYLGQSVAVSGVCLSVTSIDRDVFSVDMMPETAKRSTLGSLSRGMKVNIERALRADSRMDGHIVTGHIDTVGQIANISSAGLSREIEISVPEQYLKQVVEKGSVAIDGISLTVVKVSNDSLTVGIIPTTLRDTTLGEVRKGDLVNIETDILAKYVQKMMDLQTGSARERTESEVTWKTLSGLGWTSG
jgi:riboflavin synthase